MNEIICKCYKNKFKKLKDAVKKTMKKLLQQETCKLINEVISRKRTKKEISNKFKGNEGKVMKDPKEIGNAFNKKFANVGPSLAAKIPPMNTRTSLI